MMGLGDNRSSIEASPQGETEKRVIPLNTLTNLFDCA